MIEIGGMADTLPTGQTIGQSRPKVTPNPFFGNFVQDIVDMINPVGYQKRIDQQNLAFQQEMFNYQKQLQERIFDREDNSYQRTVNDMKNAGLSPLTIGGTNGSGEAISTNAIQSAQDAGIAQNMLFGMIDKVLGIQKQKADIDYMKTEKNKLLAEIDNLNDQTSFNKQTRSYRKKAMILENLLDSINLRDTLADYNVRKAFGVRKNASETEIKMQIIKKLLGIEDNWDTTGEFKNELLDTGIEPYDFELSTNYDNNTPNLKDLMEKLQEGLGIEKDNPFMKVLGTILNWK